MITIKDNQDVYDIFQKLHPEVAIVLKSLILSQQTDKELSFLKDLLTHTIEHLNNERKNQIAAKYTQSYYRD
jgi:hypothetical protein